jgi:hypothetical protein
MSLFPLEWARPVDPLDSKFSIPAVPVGLRLTGLALRAVFLACLLAITVRVALPQNETIWTAYETPADLVRMALGLVVCVWIVFKLFAAAPKDAHAHRTWIYMGLAAVPFAMICTLGVWGLPRG